MSNPSILFINRVYPPGQGATGRVLQDLARAFAAEDWAVTVLTTGENSEQARDGNILVHRVKASKNIKPGFGYVWVWFKLLIAGLRLSRRDIVVSLSDPPMLVMAGQIISKRKRSAHIHWCHDLYPDLLPAMNIKMSDFVMRFLKKKSRRAMKSCNRIIVIGRCMAKTLTHTGVETSRISVVPNWAPPEIYIQSQDTAPEQDNSKFSIMYAGNLGRAHPVKPILDAAQTLRDRTDIELVFVGDSPGHERLAAERDKRGLSNIRFIPYQSVERLRRTLETADVHLVTMHSETAGLLVPCKFYSALAVGRPILYLGAADTEIDKIIQSYHAGLRVHNDKQDTLAEVILRLHQDTALRQYLQNGAIKAGQDLTPAASIAAWGKRAAQI